MKFLFIILLSMPFFVFAEDEKTLATAIAEFCDFNTDKGEEEKLECGLFMVNCVVGKGGKWNDEQLFKCMKEWQERKEK